MGRGQREGQCLPEGLSPAVLALLDSLLVGRERGWRVVIYSRAGFRARLVQNNSLIKDGPFWANHLPTLCLFPLPEKQQQR